MFDNHLIKLWQAISNYKCESNYENQKIQIPITIQLSNEKQNKNPNQEKPATVHSLKN